MLSIFAELDYLNMLLRLLVHMNHTFRLLCNKNVTAVHADTIMSDTLDLDRCG
ncbi:MAG: hypothetical protein R2911_20015 [Caldilineaceae bacterium]